MSNTEMTWRKLPRTIMTDPNMDYISSCMPKGYEAAPYMFYVVAMTIADDDGIFDLEDGIIFSRLMRVGDPSLVIKIANLMLQRKIISRAGLTTKCMLSDWGYSIKTTPRTLEDRRKIVQKQIEAENKTRSVTFTPEQLDNSNEEPIFLDLDSESRPSSDDFFMSENDKNAKNVVKNIYDDKNAENVVKKNQTEKIREDKNREIEHTQNRLDTERSSSDASEAVYAAQIDEQIETELEEQWDGTETQAQGDIADLVKEALTDEDMVQISEKKTSLFGVFEGFFVKNCLGFNVNASRQAINMLVNRVLALEDAKNPANIIASVLLSQAKKLTETEGYYHGIPLTPEELLKPGMYKHVLAATSRILLASTPPTPAWMQQLDVEAEQIKQEKAAVGDGFMNEYIKYNIDPTAPNRVELLIRAKNAQSNGSNPP